MPKEQSILGVVIVAAGNSTRIGKDKIYASIAHHPLLHHTLKTFENHPSVAHICVVVETHKTQEAKQMIVASGFSKVIKVCPGGKTRQESVRLGLKCLPETKLVGIHDGARPCVTSETITNCINLAQIHGSAVPAIPVVDTIKESDTNKVILNTVDRTHLWQAQTPQVFEWAMIHEAYSNSTNEHTDDSSLLESLNIPIHLAEGDPRNIKVTTPVDLMLAEYILLNPEGA